jgi:peptidoglycan/xylan/chitin deacetylase (PgdA/CDA1 family)
MRERAEKRVALTFDAEHPDRPGCPPGAPEAMLEALRDAGVPATFFLQGRWAKAYPRVAARIAADGHTVGSHSFFHARLPLLSDEGLAFDIREAERWIRQVTGRSPVPWFRCPWGDGARDPRVLGVLEAHGFVHVGWDVVAEDWEESRSARRVTDDVVNGTLAAGDEALVLLHTWPASTAEALPGIIERLRAEGVLFATVGELRRDPGSAACPSVAAENPRPPEG